MRKITVDKITMYIRELIKERDESVARCPDPSCHPAWQCRDCYADTEVIKELKDLLKVL